MSGAAPRVTGHAVHDRLGRAARRAAHRRPRQQRQDRTSRQQTLTIRAPRRKGGFVLILLSILLAANTAAASSSIHATIRGTDDPVVVSLLRRDGDDAWHEVASRRIPAAQRQLDFGGLDAGVYQVRVQRSGGDEQAATKVNVGAGERRTAVVDVDPIDVVGVAAVGDIPLAKAVINVKHRELDWQMVVVAGDDGVFRLRLWQRGAFKYVVRSSAIGAAYSDFINVGGRTPFR